jgi:hypothetical protein
MTYDSSSLSSVHTIDSPVFVFTADGSTLLVANRGTLSSSAFHVPSVAHIPQLTMQLFSGSQIVNSPCRVTLDFDSYSVQDSCMSSLIRVGPQRPDGL